MDRTAELRWFFRSAPPRPVVDWIEKTSDPLATRTDCYLLLPGTDALGVKVRGGTTRLELKLRARPPQPLGLPGGVTGQLEEWQRWSLPRPGITRLFPRMALPKEQWIEVTKQRLTRARRVESKRHQSEHHDDRPHGRHSSPP